MKKKKRETRLDLFGLSDGSEVLEGCELISRSHAIDVRCMICVDVMG